MSSGEAFFATSLETTALKPMESMNRPPASWSARSAEGDGLKRYAPGMATLTNAPTGKSSLRRTHADMSVGTESTSQFVVSSFLVFDARVSKLSSNWVNFVTP
jgi:hypothetical protein